MSGAGGRHIMHIGLQSVPHQRAESRERYSRKMHRTRHAGPAATNSFHPRPHTSPGITSDAMQTNQQMHRDDMFEQADIVTRGDVPPQGRSREYPNDQRSLVLPEGSSD